jgi:hypothetical protein
MKQADILAAVRANGRVRDSSQAVGGTNAQVVPTEFLPAAARSVASASKAISWAEKIQAERDAQRAADKQAASAPEGAEAGTQPDGDAGDEGKAERGAHKPRTARRTGKPASS